MTTTSSAKEQYYLQDSRGNVGDNLMFWKKGGSYTSDISAAELFSEDQAFDQNASRSSDVPWPAAYINGLTRPVVDMQYVKEAEAQAYADCEQFYLQISRNAFVGNDILFKAKGGRGQTTNLDQAKVLTRVEAFDGDKPRMAGILWPKSYIDQRSRLAADYHFAKIEDALQHTSRKLAKPERIRRSRHRCGGCGIFLSAENYYCGPCPRCSCENRP